MIIYGAILFLIFLGFVSVSYADELILHHTFDGEVNDFSTISQTLQHASTSGVVDGKISLAHDFDGIDNIILFDYEEIGTGLSTPSFTWMGWFSPDRLRIQGLFMSAESDTSWNPNDNVIRVFMNGNDGRVEFDGFSSAQFEIGNVVTTSAMTPGEWTHIAVTYNDTTQKMVIYFDGTLESQTILSTPLINQGHHMISPHITKKWDGQIDEIKMYDYSLTQNQIKEIYDNSEIYNPQKYEETYLKTEYVSLNEINFIVSRYHNPVLEITGNVNSYIDGSILLKISLDDDESTLSITPTKNGNFNTMAILDNAWKSGDYSISAIYDDRIFASTEFTIKNIDEKFSKPTPPNIMTPVKLKSIQVSTDEIDVGASKISDVIISGQLITDNRVPITLDIKDDSGIVSSIKIGTKSDGFFSTQLKLDKTWPSGKYTVSIPNYDLSTFFVVNNDFIQEKTIVLSEPEIVVENFVSLSNDKFFPSDKSVLIISGQVSQYAKGQVDIILKNNQTQKLYKIFAKSDGLFSHDVVIDSSWDSGNYDVMVTYHNQIIGKSSFEIKDDSIPVKLPKAFEYDTAQISINSDKSVVSFWGITGDDSVTGQITLSGEIVYSVSGNSGEYAFDVLTNNFENGVYFAELFYDNILVDREIFVLNKLFDAKEDFISINNYDFFSGVSNLEVTGFITEYTPHTSVSLRIITPEKVVPILISPNNSGAFHMGIEIDDSWGVGEYKIFTVYDGKVIGPEFFVIADYLDYTLPNIDVTSFGAVILDDDISEYYDMVGISGVLNNFVIGLPVFIDVSFNGEIIQNMKSTSIHPGKFFTSFFIDNSWENGEYFVDVRYGGDVIGVVSFVVE